MKKTSLFFILQLVLVGFVHSSEPSNSNRIFRSSTDYPTNSNILVGKGLGSIFQKFTTRFSYACILALMLLFSFSKTNAQSSIIGNPIKIGNIEVAQYDFPNRMKWDDANRTCLNLGQGWRLPTKDELNILYNNKNQIGNLQDPYLAYWSSTEIDKNIAWYGVMKDGFTRSTEKFYESGVRAVRNSIIGTTQLNEQKTETFQNGDKYVGEMVYSNGDIYRGSFLNGRRHGEGTYLYNIPNANTKGNYYDKGNFYYDKLNGSGETHRGAYHYIGNWKDGKPDGNGKEWSDGSEWERMLDGSVAKGKWSYEGEFANGSRNGYGEMIYSNGDIYRGPWLNNKRHGEGTYIFADSGTTYTTRMVFENDIRNDEKTTNLLLKDQQLNSQSSGTATNQTTSTPKQTSTVSNSSIDFVRVGKIDIMTKDLGEFNYSQAKNAIQALGEGWRLPTESELLIMFNNQDKIGQLRKKPFFRNQNQIFWGSYLGGSFSKYFVMMNNSKNPGLTHSTYWSGDRYRLENEFYLVRAVRDNGNRSLDSKTSENYLKSILSDPKMMDKFVNGILSSMMKEAAKNPRVPMECRYCKKKKFLDFDKYGNELSFYAGMPVGSDDLPGVFCSDSCFRNF
jgi:hypothetical protein